MPITHTARSPYSSNRFIALILLKSLLMRSFCLSIDWDNVKPMFLVSMYPPPLALQSQHQHSDSDASSSSHSYSSSSGGTGSSTYNRYNGKNNKNAVLYRNFQEFTRNQKKALNSDNNNNNEKEAIFDDGFEHDPVVLNLETEPLREDMLPGGPVAMDRIFGGSVARRHCFPYQVGLLLQRPKGLYWCGGSLISDQFVLTAAHCVDMAKRALVFLGAHEIKNAKEVGQVRVMVNRSSFLVYPTWNPKRLKDDIALVRLPVPIEFNERIHAIQLPKRNYEYRNFKNKLAIASGWGRYATGVHAISGQLRFVKLRIVDGKTCKRSFPLSYRTTNICTSGKQARSTCNGDSGGPLVLQRKRSKKRVLVGITSFGSIFGCDRGYPAAFTKVASYLDWISDEASIESQLEFKDAALFRRDVKKSTKTAHSKCQTKNCPAQFSDDHGYRRPPAKVSHLKTYVFNYDGDRNRHPLYDNINNDYDHDSADSHVREDGYDNISDDEEDLDDVLGDEDIAEDAATSLILARNQKHPDAQLLRMETDKFDKLLDESEA